MLIQEQDRESVTSFCLEDFISKDNEVRVIDVFIDSLNLDELQFKIKGEADQGRPAFSANCLLKAYVYGYLNQISSSRKLAKQAIINLEMKWLLKGLQPKFRTIADFRKDNSRALKKTFNIFNKFLQGQGLFSQDTIAVDGSTFRAQNSKKNNFSIEKVKRHLAYLDKKQADYLEDLNQADELETATIKSEKLPSIVKRKAKYEKLKTDLEELEKEGIYQISTTDADARSLPVRNTVEVSYNNIIATEAKHKFIVSIDTTNEVDTYALARASRKAKMALGVGTNNIITTIADKGFHTGQQINNCHKHQIQTLIAPRNRTNKSSVFTKDKFIYDKVQDVYICLKKQVLKSNGKWYTEKASKSKSKYKGKNKRYKSYYLSFKTCEACPLKEQCLTTNQINKRKGRVVKRDQYQDAVDKNLVNINKHKEKYRQRQALVEHPFGTIKRQWGYTYTKLKGKEKVSGEFGLIALCYNLRRAISILGVSGLIETLKAQFLAILVLIGYTRCYRQKLVNKYLSTHRL